MSASAPGSFKDRSGRLLLFGIVALGMGFLCVGLGALQLIFLLLGTMVPGSESYPGDAQTIYSSVALYGLIGAAFAWLGLGSIRKRRWVRPLMLTLAWTWLAGGIMAAALMPYVMELAVSSSPNPAEMASVMAMVKIFMLAVVAVLGILLPAVFVWVYRDPDLLRTCEAHDTHPCWTERCPTSVLGLSVGLGACAVLVIPMLGRPALPVFNWMLLGWPAMAVLLIGAVACAYLARSTFRLKMSGWWGALLLLTLLGLSSTVSLAVLDPVELQAALGQTGATHATAQDAGLPGGKLLIAIPLAVTLATIAYMLGIRKHFTGRAA